MHEENYAAIVDPNTGEFDTPGVHSYANEAEFVDAMRERVAAERKIRSKTT
ncbi:hypothetical protein [Bradyrhizobium sp. SZCCHNR1015]|uniref:hypothetical protein n=1 Tax=Bradyrhizobium sp. SZCCHNR1015 TaxID=3057338 RepID=UPI002916D89E|nr:hypothetical protein [Bradyrhizobium sp. SZCCHNR1015]